MKYWIIRIPEPTPLGLTFLHSTSGRSASIAGAAAAERRNRGGVGRVDGPDGVVGLDRAVGVYFSHAEQCHRGNAVGAESYPRIEFRVVGVVIIQVARTTANGDR